MTIPGSEMVVQQPFRVYCPEMANKFPRIIRPKRYQKKGGLQRVKIVSILTKREGWVYKFHFKMDSKPM
jgi:hypothetical protein